ncbi:protein arginine kinase [Candidatus Hydrogenisulfobacillus filiaventi]|uniref:Protein-arginine kinase n=1 Tax=Candidatus Hydrogenisulfobacillus filiaventi TaxID=2707344 RepID=A0A6F8ZJY4_9FIRM|nr:protein arginine kinase [Bacillota bacterium]CAB1129993.1 protein arginine kinase [Candidatus Hydrogenisulfobacillus filiaventi]
MKAELGRFSEWMSEEGPEADIVLSSRVRLARNLRGIPFPHHAGPQEAEGVRARLEEVVRALSPQWGLIWHNLGDLDAVDREVLMEKHLASPHLAQGPQGAALAIDRRESISLMVNEEDHLRLQVILPGLQLNEALGVAMALDDAIEQTVDYAFDPALGYLTAWPTNVGTGMRASVMLHLPALVLTRQAAQVLSTLAQVGMVVRGLYGEGSEAAGNIFQVSNQVALGLGEEELVHSLTQTAQQLVGRERMARQLLLTHSRLALADRVWRALGVLRHARVITSEEALRLLSDVKLGMDLGLIDPVGKIGFAQLMVLTRPGFLQAQAGHPLTPLERDQVRAGLLRERLAA